MTHHESVRLTVGEQSLDLGVEHATEGNNGINIAPLLKETGDVTYDPGFMNTANAKSAVTYIDGDQGILRYRGYAIEDLAEHSSFMEVAYLLIYGELPESKETLEAWETNILRHNMVHEDLKLFFNGFPRDAHPMPVLSSSVSGLSTFYPDSLDPHDPEQVHISTVRLLGKLPVLASYAFKKSLGQPFMYPHNSLNYVENFLRLCFGVPAEEYDIDPDVVKALDLLLMLHADHDSLFSLSTSARAEVPRRNTLESRPSARAMAHRPTATAIDVASLAYGAAEPASFRDESGWARTPLRSPRASVTIPIPPELPGLLDGMHCDDELCVRFGVSWSELNRMLQWIGSPYAATDVSRILEESSNSSGGGGVSTTNLSELRMPWARGANARSHDSGSYFTAVPGRTRPAIPRPGSSHDGAAAHGPADPFATREVPSRVKLIAL